MLSADAITSLRSLMIGFYPHGLGAGALADGDSCSAFGGG